MFARIEMKMFKRVKLSTRIIGLVSFLLVMLSVISLFSLRQIHILEGEVEEIAKDDIPLMRVVSQLTQVKLDQATVFSELLQFGFLKQKEKFEEENRHFREAGQKTGDVIREGRKLTKQGMEHSHHPLQRKEFETIGTLLGVVEREHGDYMHHTQELIQKIAQQSFEGKTIPTEEMMAAILLMEKETKQMEDEFDKLAEHMDTIAKSLTKEAKEAQQLAYEVLIPLSILAIAGGLLLSLLIVRNIMKTLRNAMDTMTTGSAEVSSASNQIAAASQNLADQASSQAAALEEASASLSQIVNLAKKNSEIIAHSHKLFAQTDETIQAAKVMLSRAQQISDRLQAGLGEHLPKQLEIMNESMLQINMLSTNASVEATRNEATRGYAILTQEMKRFAEQSLESVRSLQAHARVAGKELIMDQQGRSSTLKEFNNISDISTRLKDNLDELNSSASEHALTVSELDQVLLMLSNNVQAYAATSEESAAASEELSAHAKQIMDSVHDIAQLMGGAK